MVRRSEAVGEREAKRGRGAVRGAFKGDKGWPAMRA